MRNTALILMDYQHDICGPDGALGTMSGLSEQTAARGILPRVAAILEQARTAGVHILHVRVAFDAEYLHRTNRSVKFGGIESKGLLQRGSEGSRFLGEAAPKAGEAIFEKGCVNPFIGTALQGRLTSLGVRELYIAGVATNFVVESAARHAGDSGFDVNVLEDLCASYNETMHQFAIEQTLPTFASIVQSSDFLSKLGDA